MSLLAYSSLFAVVSAATFALMYLDSRLFDKPKTRLTYIKTIIMTNIIVFSLMFFVMWLVPSGQIKTVIQAGGEQVKKIGGANTTFVQQIGEEMLSGDAPF